MRLKVERKTRTMICYLYKDRNERYKEIMVDTTLKNRGKVVSDKSIFECYKIILDRFV